MSQPKGRAGCERVRQGASRLMWCSGSLCLLLACAGVTAARAPAAVAGERDAGVREHGEPDARRRRRAARHRPAPRPGQHQYLHITTPVESTVCEM